MTVNSLDHSNVNDIASCFIEAFENYYVEMPKDKVYYINRWKMSKVDFSLSYGMYDKQKLVGFILHAVDLRKGVLTAYNAGTGVIPQYRGKKIIQAIYTDSLPLLLEKGIVKSTLEVITENKIGLQTYRNIGFKCVKNYKCFAGALSLKNKVDVTLKEVTYTQIEWENIPNQSHYSWDNQAKSINSDLYKYYYIYGGSKVESFFAINPSNGYIPQLEVLEDNNNNWNNLFNGISQVTSQIKINNVDEKLLSKIAHLNAIGLKNTVDQYEMELDIKSYINK